MGQIFTAQPNPTRPDPPRSRLNAAVIGGDVARLTAGLQTHRVVRSHHLRVRVELHVRLSTQGPRRCRRRTRHHEQVQLAATGRIRRDANTRTLATVTGQLADTSTRGLPTRGLDKSRTGQLAVSQMPPKEQKLSIQSRRWHPRVVQSATCPVRELSSPRVDQSARCPVRESSSPRVGNPRVGVSASCPVTLATACQNGAIIFSAVSSPNADRFLPERR